MDNRPAAASHAAPAPAADGLEAARARIAAAFEAIASHAARLASEPSAPATQPDTPGSLGRAEAEIARLTMLLDDERMANSQLEARLRAIKAREDERLAGVEAELAEARDRIDALTAERAELRAEVEAVLGALDPILAEAS